MASTSLSRILNLSQLYGTTLEDANLAAGNLAGRVGTRVERWEWLMGLHALARNKGRSHEAQQWLDEWAEVEGSPGESQRIRVLDGLFWDGDPIASARAVGMLEERAAARRGGEGELLGGELEDICVAEVWRLRHEDTHYTQEILEDLRTPSAEVGLGPLPLTHEVCAATIEALWFISEERTNAEATVARLDSLLLLGPYVETGDDVALIGNFIVAEWRESQGNLAGALAAMRRWHHHSLTGVRYLSTYLREEGRLATLTGDRDGAIRAYRHYLALRTDPEPDLKGEVDRIRVELERLLANN